MHVHKRFDSLFNTVAPLVGCILLSHRLARSHVLFPVFMLDSLAALTLRTTSHEMYDFTVWLVTPAVTLLVIFDLLHELLCHLKPGRQSGNRTLGLTLIRGALLPTELTAYKLEGRKPPLRRLATHSPQLYALVSNTATARCPNQSQLYMSSGHE